jgi:hypothetical protein
MTLTALPAIALALVCAFWAGQWHGARKERQRAALVAAEAYTNREKDITDALDAVSDPVTDRDWLRTRKP